MSRELDAQVAERVMGWTRTTEKEECEHGDPAIELWVDHDGMWSYVKEPPLYSSDITCAWQVVEKLGKDGIIFRIYSYHPYEVSAFENFGKEYGTVYDDSLASAICKMALITKGIEVYLL